MARGEQRGDGGEEGRLRLFVAVLLPEAWLAALEAVQQDLRAAGLRLRYVRPEGVHLTLKFLGEVPAGRLDTIKTALAEAAGRAHAFDLALGDPGTFGPAQRPRVAWVGLDGDRARLGVIQQAVDSTLSELDFPPESRAFNPHLTLARVPDGLSAEDAARIAPALATVQVPATESHRVMSIALMQSRLGPGGARYTELGAWALREEM